MGIVKRAADLAFTFRFIRMLVLDWKDWDAYKLGIVDEEGKRDKNVKLDTDEKKSAYTPFIRMAANIKRLLSKIPGGSSKIGSFAAALFLIKEQYSLDDRAIDEIINKLHVDTTDLMVENTWFIVQDNMLSPGVYKLSEAKLLNDTFDELVRAKDKIKINEDCYPVGNVLGIDIYKATHLNTGREIYVSAQELTK